MYSSIQLIIPKVCLQCKTFSPVRIHSCYMTPKNCFCYLNRQNCWSPLCCDFAGQFPWINILKPSTQVFHIQKVCLEIYLLRKLPFFFHRKRIYIYKHVSLGWHIFHFTLTLKSLRSPTTNSFRFAEKCI